MGEENREERKVEERTGGGRGAGSTESLCGHKAKQRSCLNFYSLDLCSKILVYFFLDNFKLWI